jgi:hypothetical protein
MAFLAAAVGVVVLLTKLAGSDRDGSADDEAVRLRLPALVASDRDQESVAVQPLTDEGGALADLGRGGVLLVFAKPSVASGIDTARLAVDLHRRLRDRAGLRVDSWSRATRSRRHGAQLRRRGAQRLGVTGDVRRLRPRGDDGVSERWRRTHWKVDGTTPPCCSRTASRSSA